jgi:cytochrome c2
LVKTALRALTAPYAYLTRRRHDSSVVGLPLPRSALRRRHRRAIATAFLLVSALIAYSALILSGGILAGVLAERDNVPARLARRLDLEQRLAAMGSLLGAREHSVQRTRWREIVLNQHTLEWARIRVRPAGARGGALVEVGGHLLFSSPLGRINYLNAQNQLRSIALQAPLNLSALRQSSLIDDPRFILSEFRVHDLAARQTGPQAWELYASLSRFGGEGCYQFKVVRARLLVTADSVFAPSPDWQEVYTARPGCIPDKDRGWLFQGSQAGGRMAFTGENTMLVTVGDHQFDGFNDSRSVSMSPDWDLGKIIELDLDTGAARAFAIGLRNPQGLVVMRDGRIFSTEHGPQGGDEINFIREGANYGWPDVSYGMNYGFPRRDWPGDPHPGGHGGYTRPAFAFVPSIGISNLVQPTAEEFPHWGENDLLLASMRAGTLFHVAVHQSEVAYVEPVEFGDRLFERERLRDIISLQDGRIAILTDSGNLIFLRNADRHARESRELVVTGYGNLSEALPEERPRGKGSRVALGRQYFSLACASCHSLDGRLGTGPPLNGVVGRRIGAVEGYPYSSALSRHGGVWREATLRSYITDPQQEFHGSTMPQPTISWTTTDEIVAYLRTVR